MSDYYQQLLTSELAKGGRALIVGGGEEQFPPALRGHPRLIFWDSDSPKFRHPDIPANTRAVMLLRFVTRSVSKQLAEQAKKRNIFCVQKLNTTGEITRMLTTALDATNPENRTVRLIGPNHDPFIITTTEPPEDALASSANDSAAPQPPIEGGTITDFVRRHRHDFFQRLTHQECEELVKVAATEGIITSPQSIKGIYYLLRSRSKPLVSEVVVEPPPPPTPPPPPPSLPALTDDSSHTVKLLTRLTQFADLFDVVGELHTHVEAVLKENAELLKYKTKYLKMIDAANDVEVKPDALAT